MERTAPKAQDIIDISVILKRGTAGRKEFLFVREGISAMRGARGNPIGHKFLWDLANRIHHETFENVRF